MTEMHFASEKQYAKSMVPQSVHGFTTEDLADLVRQLGQFTLDQVKPLRQRIDQLEARMAQFKYVGVWTPGQYQLGNFVTHGGSLWHCGGDTTSKPGEDPRAWTLCVKRGQDGTPPRVSSKRHTW